MTTTTTPTRTPTPVISPVPIPDTRKRYNPDRDHCPAQRERTVRRIRRIIAP